MDKSEQKGEQEDYYAKEYEYMRKRKELLKELHPSQKMKGNRRKQ